MKGRGGREGRTQLEVARGAVQQQGLLQPCIIWLCIPALRIKRERLFVALSFEMIVTLFLKVLRNLFSFLVRICVSAVCAVP